MAKEAGLRKVMAEIHTWTGLVCSWILFVIFLAGSIAFFRAELDVWMQPELPFSDGLPDERVSLATALDYLRRHAPNAAEWSVSLPTERSPYLDLGWTERGAEEASYTTISPYPNAPQSKPHETAGAGYLVSIHSNLAAAEYGGYWLTAAAAVVALAAVISGVIVHKKILAEFFTFRAGKKLRSWLDAHNLLGVLPLPFHVMIVYSGLLLTSHTVMTYSQTAAELSDEEFEARSAYVSRSSENAGKRWEMADWYPTVQKLRPNGTDAEINLTITDPDRKEAVLSADYFDKRSIGSNPDLSVAVRLRDGAQVYRKDAYGGFEQIYSSLYSLHTAGFADYPTLWLYFFSGMAGCGMIATGAVMWPMKRRNRKQPPLRGIVWAERINIAVFAGFPLACTAFFCINRLLPADWDGREIWEAQSLFTVWAAAAVAAFFPCPAHIKWRGLFYAAAALCTLIPLLDIYVGRPLWLSIWSGDTLYWTVELCFLTFAAIFFLIARRIAKAQ